MIEIVLFFVIGLLLGIVFAAYRLKGNKTITQTISRVATGGGGGPQEPP